jgi:uncharacterized OB-fold protein
MAPPPNPRFSELAPYAYGLVELETENIVVFGIITNAAVDAETMDKYYRECPMAVVADIIEVKGLPILAFRLI